jgi:ABC-type multidrug transport system permease subunit
MFADFIPDTGVALNVPVFTALLSPLATKVGAKPPSQLPPVAQLVLTLPFHTLAPAEQAINTTVIAAIIIFFIFFLLFYYVRHYAVIFFKPQFIVSDQPVDGILFFYF